MVLTADCEVVGEEMLVSGSDDFTLFLWKPGSEKTPVARMTGWNRTALKYVSKISTEQICNLSNMQIFN